MWVGESVVHHNEWAALPSMEPPTTFMPAKSLVGTSCVCFSGCGGRGRVVDHGVLCIICFDKKGCGRGGIKGFQVRFFFRVDH